MTATTVGRLIHGLNYEITQGRYTKWQIVKRLLSITFRYIVSK